MSTVAADSSLCGDSGCWRRLQSQPWLLMLLELSELYGPVAYLLSRACLNTPSRSHQAAMPPRFAPLTPSARSFPIDFHLKACEVIGFPFNNRLIEFRAIEAYLTIILLFIAVAVAPS